METFSTKRTSSFKIIAVLLLVASLSLGAYINTSKEVKITIDFKTKSVQTYAKTVEELLKEQNITLEKDGYINLPKDTKLEDDMKIEIRTPRTYILKVGNERTEIKSTFTKTGDILKDIEFKLGEKDYTYPKLDSRVRYGSEIEVFKVKEEIEEIEESIPFESLLKDTDKLDKGDRKVVQEGQEGLKKIKVKKVYENGKLVKEKILEESILKEPINKITHNGTRKKPVLQTSRGKVNVSKTITMNATAYDDSPQSQGKWVGTTAIGVKPRVGIVAVDPRVIPLGTKLYIESLDGSKDYGYCIAGDTGGAIKGNRVDLFFNTRGEVRNFGRRTVKVHILN